MNNFTKVALGLCAIFFGESKTPNVVNLRRYVAGPRPGTHRKMPPLHSKIKYAMMVDSNGSEGAFDDDRTKQTKNRLIPHPTTPIQRSRTCVFGWPRDFRRGKTVPRRTNLPNA
eukprot:scaffold1595_cov171-Amphora_coffeaeformis.AAC.19